MLDGEFLRQTGARIVSFQLSKSRLNESRFAVY